MTPQIERASQAGIKRNRLLAGGVMWGVASLALLVGVHVGLGLAMVMIGILGLVYWSKRRKNQTHDDATDGIEQLKAHLSKWRKQLAEIDAQLQTLQ